MAKEETSTPQGFDLSTAKDVATRENEGQWVEIHSPAGDRLEWASGGETRPVRVRVAGTYSERYRRAEERMRDRRMKKASRYSGEQFERDQLRLVAACVLEWEGFFNGGKAIPCDEQNVVTVLQNAPWIQEQIQVGMQDHEGFSEASSAA